MEGGLKRFFEGSWQEAQSLLGAHRTAEGWCFRVYAPNARSVRVAGDFSDWQGLAMNRWPEGIWETTVPQAQVGQSYKYVVEGADGRTRWKADPYAVYSQLRPANAQPSVGDGTLSVAGCGMEGKAPPGASVGGATQHLRGASRLLAAAGGRQLSHLSAAGGPAGPLCSGHGLSRRGAAAGDGVSAG